MDVKPGYQQTEVGVVPNDWHTPELGSILKSMQLGGNYTNSERNSNWPLIKMGNLGRGNIKMNKLEYIDSAQPPAARDLLQQEDILFNTRNTLDLVGKVALWRGELPEAYFNSNIMRLEFDATHVSSKRFMNYILNTPLSLKSLREIAIGTTSVAAIYSRDLVRIKFPLPPKAEQEVIAEALSDTDAFIESLEQLIAKKRHIKQGVMQKLLTGKKRLPGFSGEWKVVKAGSIGQFRGGNGFPVIHQGVSSGEYPFFKVSDMNNEGNETYMETANNYISEETRKRLGVNTFPPETIVFAKVGAAIFLERKKILTKPSCVDNNMAGYVILDARADYRYIHYILLSFHLGSLVSTTALPSLNGSVLNGIKFPLPPTKAEQEAIATVLLDMDTEISTLETKLAKTRHIKQGMMQELLTGRIRLI
jgi:type I restriction enzyme, S subunit